MCKLNWTVHASGATTTTSTVPTAGPSGTRAALPIRPHYAVNISQRIAQEHCRLLNYRSTAGANISKKSKWLPTCTLKFLCLTKRDALKPPVNIKETPQLINAGLGDSSIQFPLNLGTLQCHETFKKLNTVGYELLLYQRGADNGFYHQLSHIPQGGWRMPAEMQRSTSDHCRRILNWKNWALGSTLELNLRLIYYLPTCIHCTILYIWLALVMYRSIFWLLLNK